jgi:transposase
MASAPDLLEGQCAKAILADKAYDGNDSRDGIAGMDATAVIPSKRSRKVVIPHDPAIYKLRDQIEPCFGRPKHFHRFFVREKAAAFPFQSIHGCWPTMMLPENVGGWQQGNMRWESPRQPANPFRSPLRD